MNMTYDEALEYLNTFLDYEKVMRYPYESAYKLQRMRQLCSFVNDPQAKLQYLHIGGTKGKGSVSAMTESILRQSNLKTGLYTSPHLSCVRERIQIDGEPISEDDFAGFVNVIKRSLQNQKVNPRHGTFTYFELMTCIAFLAFAEHQVDIAILEVGLGGRLDATNVVTPLVVGLAPISFDHLSILGITIERIAREKCGIIKEGVPVISGPQLEIVNEVIQGFCKAKKASLKRVGKDIEVTRTTQGERDYHFFCQGPWKSRYEGLELGLLGAHQIENAGIAIGMIEALKEQGFCVSPVHVRKGLKEMTWPGRIEQVSQHPQIVLDGAQNAASSQALAQTLKEHFRYKKLILILGISQDKDFEGVGKSLCVLADEVIFTESHHTRSASANFLDAYLGHLCKRRKTRGSVSEAIEEACQSAGPDDLILVTGSLYLVGEARAHLLERPVNVEASVESV